MRPERFVRAGDSALVVEFPQKIDSGINARCIALAHALKARCGTAIRDAVVGYCTVTVYFDPLFVDADWLEQEIQATGADLSEASGVEGDLLDVGVQYGGEFGPDLEDVARFGGLSEEEVIAIHTGTIYRVFVVGFVPGWAYMAEVDSRIAIPRRSSPRTAVPAGSVAIAGGQTGIYPAVTPGGWNIIGRTPAKPFDAARPEPFLFKAGDRVRFHAITMEEFKRAEGT
jgi:inhibitor of KinA